jgi:type I restriction-modification system DNA methylase subunit
MPIPQEITNRINLFKDNLAEYHKKEYKEEQLRTEFINLFFEVLGWDVRCQSSSDLREREVILEESIPISGKKKRMDYSFRIGGQTLFIVETKAPSKKIKDNTDAAHQVRMYIYNANASFGILTNFEEFFVFKRVKPTSDAAFDWGLVKDFSYEKYPENWDWIKKTFGRKNVVEGIKQYLEVAHGKKKLISVDDDILSEIEGWREVLAKNIALRNPKKYNVDQLNELVQKIVDRILFLRICEDRGIEKENTLYHLLDSDHIFEKLCMLFDAADVRYNSGLFEKDTCPIQSPDNQNDNPVIDDKVLKEIIRDLYEPRSCYRWDIISPAILGQVYEQFLGKVIRLTEGGQAKIEFKPEVKKAGGVFYTPEFIVNYIVKHTVGELVKGKTPRDVSKLRILDPACGSGSFLIGAYQYLLDWHLEWYRKNLIPVYLAKGSHTDPTVSALLPEPFPQKKTKGAPEEDKFPLYRVHSALPDTGVLENWKLKTSEKKRILLNNIYGVDIDLQAVEVTRLSLLLKVLEEENSQNISKQLKLFAEPALPHLEQNIKCGNSLIMMDIITPEMSPDEVNRINPFNWEREFADIMNAGGFDAVIGNPPYVRQEGLKEQKKYFETHYAVYQGTADLYTYFIEKGFQLIRKEGAFSYIVGNKWMRANFGKSLRKFLKGRKIIEIIDFGDLPVFQNATTYPCIIRCLNSLPSKTVAITRIPSLSFSNLEECVQTNQRITNCELLNDERWALDDQDIETLISKIKGNHITLDTFVQGNIIRGIITGLNEAFVIDPETKNKIISRNPESETQIKSFLVGKDIKRYQPVKSRSYVILFEKGWTNSTSKGIRNKWIWLQQKFPAISDHLLPYMQKAENRWDKGEYWWELRACEFYPEFEKTKILWPGISSQITSFTLDSNKFYGNDNTHMILSDDKYLLGILNSKLNRLFLKHVCDKVQGGFYRLKISYISQIPIRTINFSDPADKTRHDNMVELVTRMLDYNKKVQENGGDKEKNLLQRQIEVTDTAIDKLIYELYDLTPEEIKIVEENSK